MNKPQIMGGTTACKNLFRSKRLRIRINTYGKLEGVECSKGVQGNERTTSVMNSTLVNTSCYARVTRTCLVIPMHSTQSRESPAQTTPMIKPVTQFQFSYVHVRDHCSNVHVSSN